jgi:hypothetical protein
MNNSTNQPEKSEVDQLIRHYGKSPSHESKSRFLENLSKARSDKQKSINPKQKSRDKTDDKSR